MPANFIHYLDAYICFYVINDLFELDGNINLVTNHDCFITSADNFTKLKKSYADAFNKIFNNDNIYIMFNTFIKDNNITLDHDLNDYIRSFQCNDPSFNLKDMYKSEYFLK